MQNRFWIVLAIFDIFVACISIAYIGNQKHDADHFHVAYQRNDFDPWKDQIDTCNQTCKNSCFPAPIVRPKVFDDENYLYVMLSHLNVFVFTGAVGMLCLVSEQLNCKQTCVVQFALGFLAWLCAGWTYRWGSIAVMTCSAFALAVESFGSLFFVSQWNKRNDTSFMIIVFMEMLVSFPVILLMYNFVGGRVDVFYLSAQILLGIVITLSMLAAQFAGGHFDLNQTLIMLVFLGLFYNNMAYSGTMLSVQAMGFLVPLYLALLLSPDSRYLYGAEVLVRLLIVVVLLYELA